MHRAVIGERLSPRVTWTACCSPRRRGCSRATPRARRSRSSTRAPSRCPSAAAAVATAARA
eukprot:6737003-Prymnesium_polylepis.1